MDSLVDLKGTKGINVRKFYKSYPPGTSPNSLSYWVRWFFDMVSES
jgi:hypothetical protein